MSAAVVRALLEEWQLTPDGEPTEVVPVRTSSGRPAVLRVGAAEYAHLALQHWHGRGAVQLLRADPHRSALLLERLHPEDLGELWDVEACEVVGGLYARLHVPAIPQLRTLTSYAEGWVRELDDLPRDAPLPRRLVEQAASLGRDLSRDDASTGRTIHTDLHYAHVLAGDREPWLAIAPRPLNGDPHYEVAPMLWHRWDELVGGPRSIRDGVRLRFHTLVDVAGLDERRARDWVVVRTVVHVLHALQGPRGPSDADLTRCIAIAKAVQD
ncbi:aminoglycoside phosphotransferase family protein [Nocardioides sp. URHA0020]|uniref:aminoglycoside phosphotransferase family protein n=1 Tax=Nocardioides sp. URHA0020 TaxID=1380392 RepID=UPI001E3F2629|nr:aminoglycoside phosphotransferase family protein [Nocardioides sp. URHA0020]